MDIQSKKPNGLINETSPYLLEHAYNPVFWYAWNEEAFRKARKEDKPVFLSIGYSSCHWCHVMARESFEDEKAADVLNKDFVCIKVDREERPDIDGVYMRACQAMTGSGGWPMSVFMTPEGEPFFAGTYFPRDTFINLAEKLSHAWRTDREALTKAGRELMEALASPSKKRSAVSAEVPFDKALQSFREDFDADYGGFGIAPKFPSAHNLLFLLYTERNMAEKTLVSMYRGGIFDHIGGGFSRYSTDPYWLVPHFEKMLYDNAMLMYAYLTAYEATENELYKDVALSIYGYLNREMSCEEGGLYSAQDADFDGDEGKFYLFTPDEIKEILGDYEGEHFCLRYGITPNGSFEGKSVPNMIMTHDIEPVSTELVGKVFDYRKKRGKLRTDHKRLTAWNALSMAAYAAGARILEDEKMLAEAKKLHCFIEEKLSDENVICAGITESVKGANGFLDDYAYYIFALINLYHATLDETLAERACALAKTAVSYFWDRDKGGFYFSSENSEKLVLRVKETYDGAVPSGNSVMAYNLSRLALITEEEYFSGLSEKHNAFMNAEAAAYPQGYGFYLYSMLPVKKIVCSGIEKPEELIKKIKTDWAVRIAKKGEKSYPSVNGKPTYYVCENGVCRPPVHDLEEL